MVGESGEDGVRIVKALDWLQMFGTEHVVKAFGACVMRLRIETPFGEA